jgi:hypothetical protein
MNLVETGERFMAQTEFKTIRFADGGAQSFSIFETLEQVVYKTNIWHQNKRQLM